VGVMFLMFFLQCLGKVIVEIKAGRQLVEENEAQLLNYLKATAMEVGLLLNFGPKPEVRRKAFDNLRK
jgi:GxxExxY protein